ncbi:MAG: nucleotidyltransferase domain-containing protein [Aquificaceae bacterium]|jgi:predicted nucleotidyltransferase|uniref:nucleotidyltransferase domain-containing protein n=1 Tax=Hydrogenobacter sp. Uz 6-8 TaxID=3384828 RepID=UPI000F299E0F|nr:MAG: nucleotidyltransferase domain-containing protein [Aquificota bacterium]
MNRVALDTKTLELLKSVFRKYPEVEKVYLFGSRARGNYSKASDIDLFLVAPGMSFDRYLKLYSELEELDIPYKIDLIMNWQLPEEALEIYPEKVDI